MAGGTISGPVAPATDLSQPESQSKAISFKADTSILITSSIKKFLVAGQLAKDGVYTYSYKLNSNTRGNTLVAIELSIDTQAHTQLIAVGNPTAQALMQHNQHEKGTSKQASLPSNRKNGLLSNLASPNSGTQSVKYTTDWYDPIGIEVNALTDYLTFSYDGSTATYLNGSDSRWWLSDDGWVEQSHNIYTYNSTIGSTNVATDDVFANTPFCVGQTTYVYDTQNTAEGFRDGSVGGVISNAYATGGCSALLHYSSWLN